MKRLKRIMALVIAMAMVVAMALPAFATSATGNLTPDTKITVDGLNEGDKVNFYKLIQWVPNEGWKWATGVESAATTAGVTLPTLRDITGYLATENDPTSFVEGKISAEQAGILAQVAQKLTAVTASPFTVATGETSVEYDYSGTTDAEQVAYMGLYVALVDPATAEYLYNPIFVAADYNPDSTNTNSITVAEGTLSYSPEALAKKEKVTLTKTSGTATDVQYDVKVGDVIDFTIKSVVPEYSSSYVNPQYEISDTMSEGLTLVDTDATNHSDIVVKVIDSTATDKDTEANWQTLTNVGNYPQYSITTTANGFTVTLNSNYLKSGDETSGTYAGTNYAKDIKITYKGKVTTIPDENIVQKENTATVKFSNNPGDSSSYSLLEDKTNHYVFSLDANMLGKDNWENSELVKIGLSPDGTEITQSKLSNGTMAGILEGAKFGLYTDEACTTLYTNSETDPATTGYFTSDSNGKLNISGLDAGVATGTNTSTGTYYLKETDAPAGYIASTDKWKIEIIAHYGTVAAGSYYKNSGTTTPRDENDILVNYDAYDYLTDYSVVVTNLTTNTVVNSDFTITNSGTQKKIAVSASGDATTKLNNTRGTELPSTGGIGTTIFYVVGAILVIGAGVVMITRRRMDA